MGWGRGPTAGLVALILVAVPVLAGCSGSADEPAAKQSASPAQVANNVIGDEGLSLDVEGVTVDIPPGAANGAAVEAGPLTATAVPRLVDVSEGATASHTSGQGASDEGSSVGVVPLAGGVSVSLDGGQTQPSMPVRVTFPLPAESLPTSEELTAGEAGGEAATEGLDDPAAEPAPESTPEPPTDAETPAAPTDGVTSVGGGVAAGNVAFLVESQDGTVELVPAVFDPVTGTVSGDVAHFSGIWPVQLDIGAMVDTVLLAVGAISPKPKCADQPVTVGNERYTVTSNPMMWMCLRATDGVGLEVSATANASFPFYAAPDIAADAGVSKPQGTAASVASAWARDFFGMVPDGQVAVFPSEETLLSYDQAPGDLSIDFSPAPELLLVAILAEVGSVAFSMTPAELAKTFGQLECMGGVGELIRQAADNGLAPAAGAEILSAFFACAGTVASLTPAQEVVVALFSAAPQLLIGTLWGAITTMTGASSFSVVVFVRDAGDAITAADLEPFVGTWSGAVDQPGSRPYGVEVTISVTPDGFAAAQVRYPELDNCQGFWDGAYLRGASLHMVEHIQVARGSCVETVDIVVRRVGDQLSYTAGWDGVRVAKGRLSRGTYKDAGSNTGASWPTGVRILN